MFLISSLVAISLAATVAHQQALRFPPKCSATVSHFAFIYTPIFPPHFEICLCVISAFSQFFMCKLKILKNWWM